MMSDMYKYNTYKPCSMEHARMQEGLRDTFGGKKFLNSSTRAAVAGGNCGGSVVDILLCKSIISRNAHCRANFPGATHTHAG